MAMTKISYKKIKDFVIVCIETNEVYGTIKEASEWCHGNIKAYLRGESKYAGKHPETGEKLHWMYYNE